MTQPHVAAYMHFGAFDDFQRANFKRSEIRKGFAKVGRLVQKEARKLTGKAKRSGPDGYPGHRTGNLTKSITPKVSKSGFMVRVMPNKTAGMKEYYPAYLHYGVRTGAKRTKGRRRQADNGRGWRIAPHKNFMEDALQNSNDRIVAILQDAFAKSLHNG